VNLKFCVFVELEGVLLISIVTLVENILAISQAIGLSQWLNTVLAALEWVLLQAGLRIMV